MRVECAFGDGEVNTGPSAYSRRQGWVKAKLIRLAEDPIAWAHHTCLEEALFDSPAIELDEGAGANCWFCDEEIKDPRDSFARAEVWASKHGIIPISSARGWAHPECIKKQKAGGDIGWDQTSLFE